MSITNYLTFAGGLGLLLYGIKLMGEGLELAAGSRLKHLLEKMTNLQNLAKNIVSFDIENERNFIRNE